MEKKSVGLLELETAVLECFLEKTPLSPLGVKLRMHFKKKIAKSLLQVFFAVVNGGRDVDARRIFIQFLIPMSWAKTNILWLLFFLLLVGF
jgi:hypothetical protein